MYFVLLEEASELTVKFEIFETSFCNRKCSLQSRFPQGRNHMTFWEQEHVTKLHSELNETESLCEHVQFFHL